MENVQTDTVKITMCMIQKVNSLRFSGATDNEIAEAFKQAYSDIFSKNIDFATARSIDNLVGNKSGGYWLQAYGYPKLDDIFYMSYDHATDFGDFIYKVTERGPLFTFAYDIIVTSEMLQWVREIDSSDFCDDVIRSSFLHLFSNDGVIDFETLRQIDMRMGSHVYGNSRRDKFPGNIGEVRHMPESAPDANDGYWYRVVSSGVFTCTVEEVISPVIAINK